MKQILLVIDYQHDFVDGSLGFAGAEELDERIAAYIERFRARGDGYPLQRLRTHEGGQVFAHGALHAPKRRLEAVWKDRPGDAPTGFML